MVPLWFFPVRGSKGSGVFPFLHMPVPLHVTYSGYSVCLVLCQELTADFVQRMQGC